VAPVVAIAEIKHILKSSGDQYVKTNAQTTLRQIEQGSTELAAAGHHDDDHGHGHHH
jgi:hypothetical protein